MGGDAFVPVGRYFPTPRYGVCGRPLTTSNTDRPAAFVSSSVFSATGITAPVIGPRPWLGLEPSASKRGLLLVDQSSSNQGSPPPGLFPVLRCRRRGSSGHVRFRSLWVRTPRE